MIDLGGGREEEESESEVEALAMAKEAIELSLEHRLAEGDDIPGGEPARMLQVTVDVPTAA